MQPASLEQAQRHFRKGKNRKKQDFSQAKSATVMIYLNGSDLEESYRAATEDILEIINADLSEI